MNFITSLFKKSKKALVFMLLLGVVNSVLNAGLLIFINNTIINKPLPIFPEYNWLIFILIILSSLLVSRFFQTYMIRLTNNILFDFELMILNKLQFASYQAFEELGNEKAYTAINDTKVLGHTPEVFMNLFNSAIVVFCCVGYLFWISPQGGAVVLGIMFFLLVFYLARNNKIEQELNKRRDLLNSYYRYLDDLLQGFKELKMSLVRNRNLFDKYLINNRKQGKDISIETSIKYMDNELTGYYSWYIVLGAVMFILPSVFDMNTEKTTAFLVTILFLIGPVAVLITLIPTYTSVKISAQRLNMFEEMLNSIEAETAQNMLESGESFESIRFEQVTYKYFNKKEETTFYLQPLDLTINKGEVIFITGGNGSGKSTFGNLLTGLYRPLEGTIYLNGQEVTPDQYRHYSNTMAAVFTNNYLFSENYDDFDLQPENEELADYIEMMKMEEVLKFNDEKSNFDKNLSKGQRKRLALIYALMENKDILVLDEWAAEQDPAFRRHFYQTVLPELKRKGKTIVAITHDDDYFHCATRVIKFNFGRLVKDSLSVSEEVSTSL